MSKSIKALEDLGKNLVKQIKKQENPTIEFNVRSLSNIEFNKSEKRLTLGSNISKRSFFNVGHAKKFMQTLEVAKIAKQLLKIQKHASLRDVFYMVKRTIKGTSTNIVDEQKESDKSLEDLEIITDFSREELNINANKMGSVAGNVTILDRGDTINWSKLGSGGWSIPSNVEDIEFKEVQAEYVIYMEKQAVWERLHEDKFWKKQNCIIVTSQGQTTRGIRRLLQRLAREHKLPVYVLADFDPWGFYIYSVLKFGSISLAHMSDKLSVPEAKFLGITAEDIEDYGLQKHFIKLKDIDISRLKQMSDYPWFKDNKPWQKQFDKMKKFKAKAEIQAMSARGITFISETYLPEKIKKRNFLD
ncbi:DNA topoisomerase IV subunit A [Candidatus Woesearchaeota archaeon]|nr:DNA topoisomerase IV subunit A [Candidatus Woesearchaeota archaeon]